MSVGVCQRKKEEVDKGIEIQKEITSQTPTGLEGKFRVDRVNEKNKR